MLRQLPAEPTAPQLEQLGQAMAALARTLQLDPRKYRTATGNEELVYVLHEADHAPSLYLVSDAAGVSSAPHEHQTWAIIAGISGNEHNILYQLADAASRSVRPVTQAAVKAGDYICLPADTIHATLAADGQPSCHLHLYGRPLRELPPYASRCYSTSA